MDTETLSLLAASNTTVTIEDVRDLGLATIVQRNLPAFKQACEFLFPLVKLHPFQTGTRLTDYLSVEGVVSQWSKACADANNEEALRHLMDPDFSKDLFGPYRSWKVFGQPEFYSPLLSAASAGHTNIVEILLPMAPSGVIGDALSLAFDQNRADVVRQIYEHVVSNCNDQAGLKLKRSLPWRAAVVEDDDLLDWAVARINPLATLGDFLLPNVRKGTWSNDLWNSASYVEREVKNGYLGCADRVWSKVTSEHAAALPRENKELSAFFDRPEIACHATITCNVLKNKNGSNQDQKARPSRPGKM